ncbi:GNAT family N-acetyltransferase [Mucilaginibacter sp.]|uniref:GNAT family N-acetyltransferase n=1 Tax=Mucilaginibacter sp. TaxID=1882438 RepID=UPI003D0B6AE9
MNNDNLTLIRTDSENVDFIALVALLDKDLLDRNGDQQDFYGQFNKLDQIKNVVLAYIGNIPAGCGAFKQYDTHTLEIKRMFVADAYRGRGVAKAIINELETWARELNYNTSVLETSKAQLEAIGLYLKHGFEITENYGQYKGIENSLCMRKAIG